MKLKLMVLVIVCSFFYSCEKNEEDSFIQETFDATESQKDVGGKRYDCEYDFSTQFIEIVTSYGTSDNADRTNYNLYLRYKGLISSTSVVLRVEGGTGVLGSVDHYEKIVRVPMSIGSRGTILLFEGKDITVPTCVGSGSNRNFVSAVISHVNGYEISTPTVIQNIRLTADGRCYAGELQVTNLNAWYGASQACTQDPGSGFDWQ